MMKTFQTVQKLAKIYGIASDQYPFNWRNWLAVFIFGLGIISNGLYIFYETETFQQYADSIYIATTLAATTMVFTFFVVNMQQIFDCINDEEQIINCSELLNEITLIAIFKNFNRLVFQIFN